ncbi:hypothetical protein NUW58_g8849 [Xylaria curta]|uniref:Uncharacterized protein n=1 Tax=Xylaria curta TaxID=42375 RepID=A0ACC1N5R1_9PEZI|nr:hypothetical protein NUW58_g8849 [Xylaria curta]
MDAIKSNESQVKTQRSSKAKQKRSLSGKKGKGEQEAACVEQLVEEGWMQVQSMSANTVFLCSQIIINGRLHATHKMCLCGDFVITDGLECEGNLTLNGTVECRLLEFRGKPALAKNLIVIDRGVIHGDVVVSSSAYIKATCIISGTLTVMGDFKLHGYLKCKTLKVAGTVTKIASGTRVLEEQKSAASVDADIAKLA